MNIFGRTTVPQGIFAMTETGKQPNAVGGAATSTAPEPQVKTNGKRPRAASPEYGPPSTTSAVRNPPSAFTNCTPAAVPSFGSLGPANLDQQFAKKTKPSSPEYQPEHGAFASQYALFDPRPSFGSKTARPQFAFGAPGFSNPASTKDQQSTALTRVDSHLGSTYGRLTPVAPEPANSQTTVATQTQTLNTAPAFDLRFKVMFKTGHDSDLTVTAEDKSFQVHKVVLCPLSPYFAKTRSPDNEHGFDNVTVPETSEVVDSLLRYMYGLEVPIFQATLSDTLDFAWKVLHGIESLRVAAVKYEITSLASAATEQLSAALGCFTKQPEAIASVATSLYANTKPTDLKERAVVAGATFAVLAGVMATEKARNELLDCRDLCGDVLSMAADKQAHKRQARPL